MRMFLLLFLSEMEQKYKLLPKVLEKAGVKENFDEIYQDYDRIYEESGRLQEKEEKK